MCKDCKSVVYISSLFIKKENEWCQPKNHFSCKEINKKVTENYSTGVGGLQSESNPRDEKTNTKNKVKLRLML